MELKLKLTQKSKSKILKIGFVAVFVALITAIACCGSSMKHKPHKPHKGIHKIVQVKEQYNASK